MIAEELNGQHIGREIQFRWQFDHSKIHATIWGELREVHHDGGDVTVWLTGSGVDSYGEKTEFTLDPGTHIARPDREEAG